MNSKTLFTKHLQGQKPLRFFFSAVAFWMLAVLLPSACGDEAPPFGQAVENRDSASVMSTYGVSKLISDSGVIKYKIIAEEWCIYDRTLPPRQEFLKGIFLEQYNEAFQPVIHITADTAYCFNQNLWELRGRVLIKNHENGTIFRTEELYWDMREHIIYSNKHMKIVTPDREIEGDRFRSNEEMTKYHVSQSRGSIPVPKEKQSEKSADSLAVGNAAESPLPTPKKGT